MPQVEALIDRAFVLDPDYDHGAIHQFLIAFEGVRVDADGDPAARCTHTMKIPIVSAKHDSWFEECKEKIKANENQEIITPFYGQDANITKPKK